MKKFLLLTLTIVVACATAMAAPIDATKAQQKATQFLTSEASPLKKVMPSDVNATLIKTEMGEKAQMPVYYIFNTSKTFVIVSGDDRAEDILFVGDAPLNLDRIPKNMQALLDGFKEQLDWLLCNPDAKVEKPSAMMKNIKAISNVSPMLTCTWDQDSPFNNLCKFTYSGTTYTCYTGCPATAAAQVMYYWKYPTAQVGPLASYTNTLDIGSYYTNEVTFTYPALSATTFDWANMKDSYRSYNSTQANAVATLMRYVGQAEKMAYGRNGSGITTAETQNFVTMFTGFGYDNTCRVVKKASYSETNWANLLQAELAAGRPVVYLGVSTEGGHAFNVDGYNAGDNTYHVNFGWSGDGNGYCAMNAFSSKSTASGSSAAFNQSQMMVIGITPPESAFEPELIVNPTSLSFMTTPGADAQSSITLSAHNISNNVTVTVSGTGFKLLDDNNNEVTSRTISSSSLSQGSTVKVKVRFNSATAGTFTGSVTFACSGTDTKTVALNATADNSGSASDKYLDLAKYATIDQAGWRTALVTQLYAYTPDATNGVAWLTLPVYGAFVGANYQTNSSTYDAGNGPQKWIEAPLGTSNTYAGVSWSANGNFKGSSTYFSGTTARAIGYNSSSNTAVRNVSFYVTNCKAVQLRGRGARGASSSYPAALKIWECIKNGDNLTVGTQVASKTNTSTSTTTWWTLEQTDLEAGKIYKVEVSTYRGYLGEIAFQTEMAAISADKTGLGYLVGPGESLTKSTTITGKKLTQDIEATISGSDASYFTLEDATLDYNDVMDGGLPLEVTFNAPQETGIYEATLTLTSGELSTTLTLYGQVAEKGSAQWEYLDIQKYATLDASGWQNSSDLSSIGISKVYEFTRDQANLEAWLTIPPSMVALGYMYDDQYWAGFDADDDNINFLTRDWSATDVFKGRSNYFSSTTYAGLGHSSASSSSNTNFAYAYFCVTNCSKVKTRIYNYSPTATSSASNYTYIMIREMYLDENGNISDIADDYVYGTYSVDQNQEITFECNDLDPEKGYYVVIGSPRAVFEEIAFCTPLPELPGKPIEVEADPGITTADISWTTGKNSTSWNLRWRPWVDPADCDRFWDFEDDTQAAEFTKIDADGDGYTWEGVKGSSYKTNSGTGIIQSASYINDVGALTPNNWLITPKVKLGGSMSFYACGQDNSSYYKEHFKVYAYQGDDLPTFSNLSSSSDPTTFGFVEISSTVETGLNMTKYEYSLSNYSGYGYLLIRHFDCTDMFYLNVDDIEVTVPNPASTTWNYEYNKTSIYTITGLTPETKYEVQVQGVNSLGTSNWAPNPPLQFTTLPEPTLATLATIESTGTKGTSYTISDELVAVYADAENGLLWCKDQGNASIAATFIKTGQIDFMRSAAMTGNDGQGDRAWDQSNWVMLKFPEATVENGIATLLNGAVGKKISAGTVTGKYIDNRNYTIEVLPNENKQYTLPLNGSAGYDMNVYCAANFLEGNLNLTNESTGAVDANGIIYFFMNPKVQEICEITYAEWDGEMFVAPDNTGIQGAFQVDWSHNASGTPTLRVGQMYRFTAVVSRPPMFSNLNAGGSASDNFVVYPANLSGDDNIVTGINGIYNDSYREVIAVDYVNTTGLTSKKPFHGVNIVVTRYSDGTKTTVKKIFK